MYQVHKDINEFFLLPFSEDRTCMATGVQKVLPDTTTAPLEVWLHNVMRSCPPFPVTGYTSSESSTTNDGSTSLKSPHQPPTQAQSSIPETFLNRLLKYLKRSKKPISRLQADSKKDALLCSFGLYEVKIGKSRIIVNTIQHGFHQIMARSVSTLM